jgi:hypothetical protein
MTREPEYGAVPPVTGTSAIDLGSNGIGGIGYTWTTNSSNAIWTTNTPYTYATTSTSMPHTSATIEQSGKLSLRGNAADVDINGKSLKTWMEQVEQQLNIMTPNPELEEEWEELKKLGDRYRKLEKKCQEKAEVWKKLKSMPKVEK